MQPLYLCFFVSKNAKIVTRGGLFSFFDKCGGHRISNKHDDFALRKRTFFAGAPHCLVSALLNFGFGDGSEIAVCDVKI